MDNRYIISIESTVLGSILFSPDKIEYVSTKLIADDFYYPAHRDIYEAMVLLTDEGYPIDEDFLLKKSKKTLNEQVLIELLSITPIQNITSYVREIKAVATRRKLQNFASELHRNIDDEDHSNDDIFELLKVKEEEIRSSGIVSINKNSILDIKESEPEFYLKHWLPIPKKTITIISAPGGTGKTWLVVQLALRFAIENPNKKAFLWLSEDLNGIVKSRMNSICTSILSEKMDKKFKNIEITDSLPSPLLEKNKGAFKMSSKFNQIKAELKDYDLIVLDPLLAFYGGDENDNSQARMFMQPFMNWATQSGKSVIFLHHSSKSIIQNNSNKTRGAGAFVDAARVCYEMNKIYKKDNQTLEPTKSHMRDIKLSKDNYGAIKHLKTFNNIRHITPYESSQDYIEIEYACDDIL